MENLTRQFVGIQDLRLFGYHGVHPEEKLTGHWFVIDLKVSVLTVTDEDDLNNTLNYASLHEICLDVMGIRADLLETIATRIIGRIRHQHPLAGEIHIRVTKENPAFRSGCAAVFVEFLSSSQEL